MQGFLQLLEPEVTVHARAKDVGGSGNGVVERATAAAAKSYEEISGRTVRWTVVPSLNDDL